MTVEPGKNSPSLDRAIPRRRGAVTTDTDLRLRAVDDGARIVTLGIGVYW